MFNDLMVRRKVAPSELMITEPTDTELRPQANMFNSLTFTISPITVFTQVTVLSHSDDCNRLLTGLYIDPPLLLSNPLLTLQPLRFQISKSDCPTIPPLCQHPHPFPLEDAHTWYSLAWKALLSHLPLMNSAFSVTAVPTVGDFTDLTACENDSTVSSWSTFRAVIYISLRDYLIHACLSSRTPSMPHGSSAKTVTLFFSPLHPQS